jgi:hypothetical protein
VVSSVGCALSSGGSLGDSDSLTEYLILQEHVLRSLGLIKPASASSGNSGTIGISPPRGIPDICARWLIAR